MQCLMAGPVRCVGWGKGWVRKPAGGAPGMAAGRQDAGRLMMAACRKHALNTYCPADRAA